MINIDTLYNIDRYNNYGYAAWKKERFDTAMAELPIFTTRSQYEVWLELWWEQYKQISERIRYVKARRKLSHPETMGNWAAQSELWKLKSQARAMMWIRTYGKRRSWELRNQRLATQS